MGMSIDDAIIDIKDNIKPVVGGISLDVAIDIMEKYQKIEAIVNWPVYIQEDVIRYKMICEVLGAPRP